MDTHIYLDNERFQIKRKKEIEVMCKRCSQFGHPKKYFRIEKEYCDKCAMFRQEMEEHQSREISCFYFKEAHIIGAKKYII